MKKITLSQRLAIHSFQKKRSEFYDDLSSLLKSTDRKLIDIFAVDSERHAGTPRGVITGVWVQRLNENGADLADAWFGTLPDDEVAVLSVQQMGGANAIATALNDMARMSKLTELVVAETKKTVGAAVVALAIGLGAVTVFPIVAVDMLKDSLEMPASAWGSSGRALASWVDTIKNGAIPTALFMFFLFALVWWSFRNWTGPGRAWADKRIVLYRTLRDLSAVRFLDTMSTLARKRGNVMETLNVALDQMAEQTPSRWAKWRLNQVLTQIGFSQKKCFGGFVMWKKAGALRMHFTSRLSTFHQHLFRD
jgi:hypothetical protein